MERVGTVADLRERLRAARRGGRRVALVPTMGALHEGHLALADAAREHADLVVMSIFVNPLQFGPGEDLDRYPRSLDEDARLAAARGVDLLFVPGREEMYAREDGVRVVPGSGADRWEGEVRPGHFAGVLTVVAKLFNIVRPDVACFGQKDIQQYALIAGMVRELDFEVDLIRVPIVRDADGLALSSRNRYLGPAEREAALAVPGALREVREAWAAGERRPGELVRVARRHLEAGGRLTVDYIALAEPRDLVPVDEAVPGTVVAVAVRVGSTRLLDNTILGEEGA